MYCVQIPHSNISLGGWTDSYFSQRFGEALLECDCCSFEKPGLCYETFFLKSAVNDDFIRSPHIEILRWQTRKRPHTHDGLKKG